MCLSCGLYSPRLRPTSGEMGAEIKVSLKLAGLIIQNRGIVPNTLYGNQWVNKSKTVKHYVPVHLIS